MSNAERRIVRAAAAVFVLAAAGLAASPPPEAKVKIMATIFPLQEFARAVGGDLAETRLLIPPGAEIHSWQPRVSDIKTLATELGLFLYIGPSLEPWAEGLLKGVARPGLKVLEAGRGLDLIRGDEEAFDPHIWLDFTQDLVIVDRIAAELAGLRPASAAFFRANAEAYKAKLRALDDRYTNALRGCRGRLLLVGGHAAFGYLARRYGLVQTAVYGASPDAAPAPRIMVGIVARAKAGGVKTVFYEPTTGDRMARVLAGEIGAKVRFLYPGHNLPRSSVAGLTFLEMMNRNLEVLTDGLGCR